MRARWPLVPSRRSATISARPASRQPGCCAFTACNASSQLGRAQATAKPAMPPPAPPIPSAPPRGAWRAAGQPCLACPATLAPQPSSLAPAGPPASPGGAAPPPSVPTTHPQSTTPPPGGMSAGCAGGDRPRLWRRDHPLPQDLGQPAHGHRLHRAVHQGAAAAAPAGPGDSGTCACAGTGGRSARRRHVRQPPPPGRLPAPPAWCCTHIMCHVHMRLHTSMLLHTTRTFHTDPCASPAPAPQLSNVMNTEQLFYTCIFPFIAFFGAFAFVLYPLKDQLHPTGESSAAQRRGGHPTAARQGCRQAGVPRAASACAPQLVSSSVLTPSSPCAALLCRVVPEPAGADGPPLRRPHCHHPQLDLLPVLRDGRAVGLRCGVRAVLGLCQPGAGKGLGSTTVHLRTAACQDASQAHVTTATRQFLHAAFAAPQPAGPRTPAPPDAIPPPTRSCRSPPWMRPSSSTPCSAWAPTWRSSSPAAPSRSSPRSVLGGPLLPCIPAACILDRRVPRAEAKTALQRQQCRAF